MLKFTQVKAGYLTYLFESVHQSVSMYEQLAGGL